MSQPWNYGIAYLATAATMVALDLLWLGVVARSMYQRGIGHLMADAPRIPVAIVFYLLFAVGLVVFAVAPGAPSPGLARTAWQAALFGFLCYATYDLTNLATLRGWPCGLSLIDMAWGTAVSTVAAVAGRAAVERWGGA
jgi:uncharacterized membrane protein